VTGVSRRGRRSGRSPRRRGRRSPVGQPAVVHHQLGAGGQLELGVGDASSSCAADGR
jgi:hypothetical protein